MKFDIYEFSSHCYNQRKSMNIPLRTLSEKSGISSAELSRLENGMKTNISVTKCFKLCTLLSLNPIDVFHLNAIPISDEESRILELLKDNSLTYDLVVKLVALCEECKG